MPPTAQSRTGRRFARGALLGSGALATLLWVAPTLGIGPIAAIAGATGASTAAGQGDGPHSGVAAAPASPTGKSTPADARGARPTRAYVVNIGSGSAVTPAQLRATRAVITAAGGQVIQEWPQIGVVIAHSSRARFVTTLTSARAKALGITSVGPTRTVPVRERLRPIVTGPAGHDSSPLAAAGEAAGASAAQPEPDEAQQWGLVAIGASATTDTNTNTDTNAMPRAADGRTPTVAVVDSGIEADHPDLRGRIDVAASVDCTNAGRPDTTPLRWRNTTSGHGTHVAGIIAAARNGVGIAGVAPGARVASVKVVNDDGFIYPEYAICGILRTAQSGVRVANHSYYVDPWRYWCASDRSQAPAREAVRRAFAAARAAGVLSVVAAGNDSIDLTHKSVDSASPGDGAARNRRVDRNCLNLPAELPGVLPVGALDPDGTPASYTNYGRRVVTLYAPGSDIRSSYPQRTWTEQSGTSMAAPHASGVAARLLAAQPDAGPDELAAQVLRQTRPLVCDTIDIRCRGARTLHLDR